MNVAMMIKLRWSDEEMKKKTIHSHFSLVLNDFIVFSFSIQSLSTLHNHFSRCSLRR